MTHLPPKRKSIPVGIKLAACLDMLGLLGKEIQWDHDPALGLRPFNETDYDPPQLDPHHIRPKIVDEHALKTNGSHVPLSGDKSKIAKTKRLRLDPPGGDDFRRKLLEPKSKREKKRPRWPSRKLKSRPLGRRK